VAIAPWRLTGSRSAGCRWGKDAGAYPEIDRQGTALQLSGEFLGLRPGEFPVIWATPPGIGPGICGAVMTFRAGIGLSD